MKFVCERCHTRYSIADDKVRQKILKIRCKTCENVITIRDPGPVAGPEDASAAPPPAPRAGLGERAAAREWFIAVNGDQTGPMSRSEAARRIVALKPDDEVYVWKDGQDGWKPPEEVPPVHQEVVALRGRPAPPPPRLPVPPPPRSAPKSAPPRPSSPAVRAAKPKSSAPAARASSGRGSMPATASLPDNDAFAEEERTQIQPFDAGLLASDVLAKPAAPAAVLPFAPKMDAHPLPEPAPPPPAALDGLFSDLPPPATAHAATPVQAPSGLSKLVTPRRSPVVKFVAAGAVVAVLIVLVVVVLGSRPNDAKVASTPSPAPAAASAPAAPEEAQAREEADRKFQAIVPEPAPSVREVRRVARGAPPKNHQPTPSLSPPALEPAPLSPDQAAAAPHRVAMGERRVPELRSQRAGATSNDSGPTESMISAVVKRNQATIKTCYERALKRDDRLRSGRIDVSASVGASGIVRSVSLTAPPEFVTVESCIKTAVRRWAFPSNSDEYKIEFPLILAGSL